MTIEWTKITAIWGASLSSILALFEAYKYFSDRVKLKVKVQGGYKVYPKTTPYGDMELVTIIAANCGRRPVTLTKAALLMPKKAEGAKYYVCMDSLTVGKHIRLEEGESYQYNFDENEVKKAGLSPDKYVACVIDARGKYFWSHSVISRFIKLKRIK